MKNPRFLKRGVSKDFRSSNDLEQLEIESEVFAEVRDKTPGREIRL